MIERDIGGFQNCIDASTLRSLISGPPERPLAANLPVYALGHGALASSRDYATYQQVCMLIGVGILNFVVLRPGVYGKLEKPLFQSFGAEVSGLLARHSFPGSEESNL